MRDVPPLELIEYAAERLGDLCREVTFLGGAVVGLLVTDRGASPPRVTKDVDVVAEIHSRIEYYALDKRLLERGFRNDMKGPICRYLHGILVIDVMPTDPDVLGFSNRWYSMAIESAKPCVLESGTTINLITPECFLATKMEAFEDPHREGHRDIFASRDLADILRVVEGRPAIVGDVMAADDGLRGYLQGCFARLRNTRHIEDAVEGNVERGRAGPVMDRINALANPKK